MKPWIDPRERRARWYFSTLMVIGVGALVTALILLMSGGPTSEEVPILVAVVVILIISLFLGVRQLRRLPRDFNNMKNNVKIAAILVDISEMDHRESLGRLSDRPV